MIILMDNGSLEPAPTLALRALAARLAGRLAAPVAPVSLLHSSKISADELGGVPADTLEAFIAGRARAGESDFLVLPLFFGPSLALADYLPKRIAALRQRFPSLSVRVAPCLCADEDGLDTVAGMLERSVRFRLADTGPRPRVVAVDHGSPAPAVTAVRDALAERLRVRLGDSVSGVMAASMERREGPEYDFNEPLLKRALATPGYDAGEVIVALQFLFSGRHAGPGGDIAQICAEAIAVSASLRCHMTEPLAGDPALVELLARRAAGVAG